MNFGSGSSYTPYFFCIASNTLGFSNCTILSPSPPTVIFGINVNRKLLSSALPASLPSALPSSLTSSSCNNSFMYSDLHSSFFLTLITASSILRVRSSPTFPVLI